jgi:hypothetical protein
MIAANERARAVSAGFWSAGAPRKNCAHRTAKCHKTKSIHRLAGIAASSLYSSAVCTSSYCISYLQSSLSTVVDGRRLKDFQHAVKPAQVQAAETSGQASGGAGEFWAIKGSYATVSYRYSMRLCNGSCSVHTTAKHNCSQSRPHLTVNTLYPRFL